MRLLSGATWRLSEGHAISVLRLSGTDNVSGTDDTDIRRRRKRMKKTLVVIIGIMLVVAGAAVIAKRSQRD